MVEKAAANDAYGGTATSLRKALNAARLAGSLDEGLRRVARDTPSRELLAPFLLKFRKHAATGDAALAEYLRTESRMLAHRQDRPASPARRFLELLTELFVVVLVLPALLVIAATALTVVVPELPAAGRHAGRRVVPTRAVVLYGAVVFLVAIGLVGAVAVGTLRPPNQRASYDLPAFPAKSSPRPGAIRRAPRSSARRPRRCSRSGSRSRGTLSSTSRCSYAAFAVPVGAVAGDAPGSTTRRTASWRTSSTPSRDTSRRAAVPRGGRGGRARRGPRRARRRRGRPRVRAPVDDRRDGGAGSTERARDTGSTGASAQSPGVRAAAIDRFVQRVGTPLAEGTLGLVTDALNAGSDADAVFETLRIEVGRLYSEQRALRSSMHPYVAVGWAAAALVAAVVAVVNTQVIDAAHLADLAGATDFVAEPETVLPELERFRLYVTQATMLASGWFAGTASRGRYAALFHSGLLVAICYAVFTAGGLV